MVLRRTKVSQDYIPHGTNLTSEIDPSVLEKYGLKLGGYVLFVGRLVYEKDAHTVIEAFKSVQIDLRLVVIGDTLDANEYV